MSYDLTTYLTPMLKLAPPVIFALYAAANAFLLLVLSVLTVGARAANGVALGDGGKMPMMQAIRAHGNASEYIPIGLILLYALVAVGAPVWVLHVQGGALVLGRICHALGLYSGPGTTVRRLLGMLLTWGSMGVGIAGAIGYGVFQ